jgi:hypothetical protein
MYANAYAVRRATEADAVALEQLAGLDSQRPLSGPVLVAEIGGSPAAAISLTDGRVIADPFQHTALARRRLRMRADALRAYERTPSLAERVREALAPFRARTRDV